MASNQITQAFHYSLIAGNDALDTYALSDALKHFEQAHAVFEKVDCDVDEILQLYQQWGRTLELAHRFEEALSVYEELASLGERFDNEMMTLVSLISQTILFATTTPLKDPGKGKMSGRTSSSSCQTTWENMRLKPAPCGVCCWCIIMDRVKKKKQKNMAN